VCRTGSGQFESLKTGSTRQNPDMFLQHILSFNFRSGKCAPVPLLHSTWLAEDRSSALLFT